MDKQNGNMAKHIRNNDHSPREFFIEFCQNPACEFNKIKIQGVKGNPLKPYTLENKKKGEVYRSVASKHPGTGKIVRLCQRCAAAVIIASKAMFPPPPAPNPGQESS